ncbi:oxidoreductase [Agromyces protaetiae]|uniref:Oxidoreductase n=1 Tax=Agromyces protaetiae TaxID=2509455 RepID=A0A4P6FAH9_9MICO|nr:molybdopterin-dependent oxidoreductase [Agromyces protaetiae]QAY72962.1 oxidoreductase [Agromyces protaetiae]
MRGTAQRSTPWWRPALAGLAAALAAAGAGQLTAALVAPESGPFEVVGQALIDLAPKWAKDAAITLFGTSDKLALLTGIAIVLLLVAAAAGALEARRPPWGRVVFGVLAFVGAVAATTRADSGPLAIVPSAVAGLVGVFALQLIVARLPEASAARSSPPDPSGTESTGPDRRRFLAWLGGTAAVGLLAALGASALQSGRHAVDALRAAVVLPRAAARATVPPGAELKVDGISPLLTPNADFYRIDTALRVPEVDPATWTLRIHGMVDQEVMLTWDEFLALPFSESTTTLACVSNEVGGNLIGNAVWLGTPVRDLLKRAGPSSDADMVLSRSIDGFTAGTPIEALTDPGREAVLAVGMNGEPLPLAHGFPVRMVVPGLFGYVSATKWLTELEVTRFDRVHAYWTDRGWSERGPVKLSSRIDVPRQGQQPSADRVVLAGVAWYQHVGVQAVEVQLDDGPWREAELATAISADTWVQWRYEWTDASPGTHTARVRAVGSDGQVQTAERRPPAPDGSTGLDERAFDVA